TDLFTMSGQWKELVGKTDLFTMSGQWKELVGKARRKALSPGDYSGGTFTLSNLGMFGVDRFDAILPIGQGAIMAVGSSIPTMVAAEDGSFGIKRQMQHLASLSINGTMRHVSRATSPGRAVARIAALVRFALRHFFELSPKFSSDTGARVVAVVGADVVSPYGGATWDEVIRQMARRVNWVEPSVQLLVFSSSSLSPSSSSHSLFLSAAQQADLLLAVAVNSAESAAQLVPIFSAAPARMAFDCHVSLSELTSLGGLNPEKLNLPQSSQQNGDGGRRARRPFSADDIWFVILALVDAYIVDAYIVDAYIVDAYIVDMPALRNLPPLLLSHPLNHPHSSSLQCMVGNCGPIIIECFLDEQCRTAINCLNECGPTDQVCSYRCIVSYETPKFEAFSLCVLQKHNCLGMTAEIRDRPTVLPLTHLRGQPVTHERAEDIFVGWLGQLPWSWRVVAGQNAAYDQFPCQFQIFYRGKARGSVWYDPVFTINTLDGRSLWRRRHYRVRRGKVPGTFTFTVLDNGVISEESWRIVDVTDDFQWALFYYSGAARAAGQSYTGAVLVSKDGEWPGPEHAVRLKAALDRCGIKEWELYRVDNSCCENAPLGLPDDAPAPVSIA
ncbi:unnamed protein product, partial [Closterium sp. NIES-64]